MWDGPPPPTRDGNWVGKGSSAGLGAGGPRPSHGSLISSLSPGASWSCPERKLALRAVGVGLLAPPHLSSVPLLLLAPQVPWGPSHCSCWQVQSHASRQTQGQHPGSCLCLSLHLYTCLGHLAPSSILMCGPWGLQLPHRRAGVA